MLGEVTMHDIKLHTTVIKQNGERLRETLITGEWKREIFRGYHTYILYISYIIIFHLLISYSGDLTGP